jgi:hypothetical protein
MQMSPQCLLLRAPPQCASLSPLSCRLCQLQASALGLGVALQQPPPPPPPVEQAAQRPPPSRPASQRSWQAPRRAQPTCRLAPLLPPRPVLQLQPRPAQLQLPAPAPALLLLLLLLLHCPGAQAAPGSCLWTMRTWGRRRRTPPCQSCPLAQLPSAPRPPPPPPLLLAALQQQ